MPMTFVTVFVTKIDCDMFWCLYWHHSQYQPCQYRLYLSCVPYHFALVCCGSLYILYFCVLHSVCVVTHHLLWFVSCCHVYLVLIARHPSHIVILCLSLNSGVVNDSFMSCFREKNFNLYFVSFISSFGIHLIVVRQIFILHITSNITRTRIIASVLTVISFEYCLSVAECLSYI